MFYVAYEKFALILPGLCSGAQDFLLSCDLNKQEI